MKKILILCNEFPPGPGGIGNQAYNLAVLFTKRGYGVDVYTGSRPEFNDQDFDHNFPFAISRYETQKGFLQKSFKSLFFLFRNARQYDVVFLSGSVQLLFALPLVLFHHLKTICIIHGHELAMASGLNRYLLKWCLRISFRVIAVSEFSKGMLRTYGTTEKVEVVPNGVEIDPGKVRSVPRTLSGDGVLRLVTVGSVTKRKGQQNVVRAIPFLLTLFPKLEYHIIGIPTEVSDLKGIVDSLGISKHITIHGVLTDTEKAACLEKMDVVILLSENLPNGDVEGFGIAVIEANLLGLPAIGSKGTGVEQAIDDGRSGILIDADQPEQFGDALIRITRSYEEFSMSAMEWSKRHDWNIIGDQYIKVIEE